MDIDEPEDLQAKAKEFAAARLEFRQSRNKFIEHERRQRALIARFTEVLRNLPGHPNINSLSLVIMKKELDELAKQFAQLEIAFHKLEENYRQLGVIIPSVLKQMD